MICLAIEMRTAGRGTSDVDSMEQGGVEAVGSGMLGSGMLLVQPPFGIDTQLKEEVLPTLGAALGQEECVFYL